MAISKVNPATMTTKAIEAEFKLLAAELSPINTRRSLLANELAKRSDEKKVRDRLKHFFPTKEDRMVALRELKEELGE